MPMYMHGLYEGEFTLHIWVCLLKQLFLIVNFHSLPVCDLKPYWESVPELHKFSERWRGSAWQKCGSMDFRVKLRNQPIHGLVKSLSCTHMLLLFCFPPQPNNLWGYCVYHTDKEVKKNFSYVPRASGFVKCASYVTVNLTFKNKTPNHYSFLNVMKT